MTCGATGDEISVIGASYPLNISPFDLLSLKIANLHSKQLTTFKMSSINVPTTTSVSESALIPAHISQVWHLLKLQTFDAFWSALSKTENVKGASPETDIIRWHFKDGTVQDIKQEEHSAIDHFITYSVITSQPALTYSTVVSKVRCWPVTTGTSAGGTFVEWTGNFSGDANAGTFDLWGRFSMVNLV